MLPSQVSDVVVSLVSSYSSPHCNSLWVFTELSSWQSGCASPSVTQLLFEYFFMGYTNVDHWLRTALDRLCRLNFHASLKRYLVSVGFQRFMAKSQTVSATGLRICSLFFPFFFFFFRNHGLDQSVRQQQHINISSWLPMRSVGFTDVTLKNNVCFFLVSFFVSWRGCTLDEV